MALVQPPQPEPSAARVEANRANAQHSTGPRTDEGKARSRMNAVKHGLFATAVLLPAELLGEDPERFAAMKQDLALTYHPNSAEESTLVERLAATWCELQRIYQARQTLVHETLSSGKTMTDAVKAGGALSAQESRLDRTLTRLRSDIHFLQRYRNGSFCRHRRAELEIHNTLMENLGRELDKSRLRILHSPEAEAKQRALVKQRQILAAQDEALRLTPIAALHAASRAGQLPADGGAIVSEPMKEVADAVLLATDAPDGPVAPDGPIAVAALEALLAAGEVAPSEPPARPRRTTKGKGSRVKSRKRSKG